MGLADMAGSLNGSSSCFVGNAVLVTFFAVIKKSGRQTMVDFFG